MLSIHVNNKKIISKDYSVNQSMDKMSKSYKMRCGSIESITNKPIIQRTTYVNKKEGSIIDWRNDADDKDADYLYQCRNEFIRSPESISTATGRRYITIIANDISYSIASTEITLPSGNKIYHGYFNDKTVISDGKLYHIESLVIPPQQPRAAMFLGILGLFTDALKSLYSLSVHNTDWLKETTASRYDKKNGLNIPIFNLPGAEAADIGSARQQHFHYFEKGHKGAYGMKNHIRNRRNLKLEEYDRTLFQAQGIRPTKKNNHCQIDISIPNTNAMQRHYMLNDEYMEKTNQRIQNLKWLAGYDDFLAEKLNTIFHEALYLKHKKECIETMLIKKYCENLLSHCISVPPDLIIQSGDALDKHKKKIKLNDYFYGIGEKLKDVCQLISFRYLREAIELKNGMSFEAALIEIKEKYALQKTNEDQEAYIIYYRYIQIMALAHKHYCRYLSFDSVHSPLDKLLFLNDKEIYWALLNENDNALQKYILVRFLYYIFEFNRNNGISIYGDTFMMPGEFTEHWNLFAGEMTLIDARNLTVQFSQQISDYFLSEIKVDSYLDRILSLMEYSHTYLTKKRTPQQDYGNDVSLLSDSISILENNIRININNAPGQFSSTPNQWHIDIYKEIKYDQECLLLLRYIKNLHDKFSGFIRYFHHNSLTLTAHNQEQRIIASKIAAMQHLKLIDAQTELNHSIIIDYQEQLNYGNIDLLLNAAAYWFMDFHRDETLDYGTLNVLEIIKEFRQQEWLHIYDMEIRNSENYTSVFDFHRYNHFTNPEDFFNQFIEYRLHDVYHEARNISFNIIKKSSLDFIDLVYPAKNAYTFKIFSRKYMQNTLAPDSWVSVPANNLGYITMIRTHTDKIALVSTLLSAPFARFIDKAEDSAFVIRLVEGWESSLFNLRLKNRLPIAASSDEIFSLLYRMPKANNETQGFQNLILIEPEANQLTHPTAEFTLIADKPSTTCESLLALIDYWSEQTLRETSNELKQELMDKSWVDYITLQIPFYNVLWNYWYDPDFEFHFREVIFDVFDIIMTIIPVGVSTNKIVKTRFMDILTKAREAKIPPAALRSFVINHFMRATPEIVLESVKNLADALASFINPIPFHNILEKEIAHYFTNDHHHKADWLDDYLSDGIALRKMKVKTWAAGIDRGLLTLEAGGIFSRSLAHEHKLHYIELHNDYFEVFWDVHLAEWRVKKPASANDINYAVPIGRDYEGIWTAISFKDADPISPFHDMDVHSHAGFKKFKTLHFEPLRILHNGIPPRSRKHYTNKRTMTLLIENLKPFFTRLITTQKEDIALFEEFALCLSDEKKLVQALAIKDEFLDNAPLVAFIKMHNETRSLRLKFRVMRRWRNEFDLNPSNLAFVHLMIEGESYIIDLLGQRFASQSRKDNEQVQFEPDWIYLIKTTYADNTCLVKYKDFYSIDGARHFIYNINSNPGRFIKGAFILKEPVWYKPLIIQHTHLANHRKTHKMGARKMTVLEAARLTITRMNGLIPMRHPNLKQMEFSIRVLKEADLLDRRSYERSAGLLAWSTSTRVPVESYMSVSADVRDMPTLNSIKAGNLLGVYSSDGLLHRLMVCVGFGRFAGMGNNFFNHRLSSAPSIILSEEMGQFVNDLFCPRTSTEPLRLIAGIPEGIASHNASIWEDLPYQEVIDINQNPHYPYKARQYLTRSEILLGKDWSLTPCGHSYIAINITMHPRCLINNHVIVSEFAHVVRALIYLDPELPDLNNLQRINFATCFDGNDGQTEFSQILANELQVEVHTRPYYVTDSIRQRNSQWFTIYHPGKIDIKPPHSPFDEEELSSHYYLQLVKGERLKDLLETVLALKQTFHSRVVKRSTVHIPVLYINIARFLLGDITFDEFAGHHTIKAHSTVTLKAIVAEYASDDISSEDIFIQNYLDILYTIEEFRHLLKWILPFSGR